MKKSTENLVVAARHIEGAIAEALAKEGKMMEPEDDEYAFYYGSPRFAEFLRDKGEAAKAWENAREARMTCERARNPYEVPGRRVAEQYTPEERRALKETWDETHMIEVLEALLRELRCLTSL
jgi:hypothetical protein